MKELFDHVSVACSKITTRTYSTSFSKGITFLATRFHGPIYSIYGFVRFADEIVDSFHDYDKQRLFTRFRLQTQEAIAERISLNPILNSFQQVVHDYKISQDLIDCFLDSMEMDLTVKSHDQESFSNYILGSAEVVGLMCLRVFTEGDDKRYEKLKPYAMRLGAAFQKVNFLRDIRYDFKALGRNYFPGIDFNNITKDEKRKIELEIIEDFEEALVGIKNLPESSRAGVYLAYFYYRKLFNRIRNARPELIAGTRVRIDEFGKMGLMVESMVRHRLNLL